MQIWSRLLKTLETEQEKLVFTDDDYRKAYEEEWRLVNVEGEPYTPLFINAPFVKSITIGLNLDDMCKQLLWDVCQEKLP